MGILDDAIRDHLELKRQHGANRDELKRLEDEAFGPPSRPGEPDFPQAEGAVAEAPLPASGAEAPGAAEEPPTTVIGANGNHHDVEPAAAPQSEREPEPEASAEPGAFPAEAPVEEHPTLDEGAASPATPYDHSFEDDLDLSELDLELDEPADAATLPPEDVPSEPEAAPPTDEHAPDPPIESLETVEHPFEPGLSDEEVESEELETADPPSEDADAGHPAGEPLPAEPAADESEEGEEGDDVLADTPEFLRDAPEDDELWFEQGEPKDFDFD